MLKHSNMYTIKAHDYKKLETDLSLVSNIPDSLRESMQTLIADHRALIIIRDRLVEEQRLAADGIFSNVACTPLNLDNSTDNSQLIDDIGHPDEPDSNESTSNDVINNDDPQAKNKDRGRKNLPVGELFNHALTANEKNCPSCGDIMHMQRSKITSVVISVPLFTTETHISESCRCLNCSTQATAPMPKHATEDEMFGRYHFSAVASLAALRYQYGMASYRIEQLSGNVGPKISDSTQWLLFHQAASHLRSFFLFLKKFAANAPVKHVDDTNTLVLSLAKGIEMAQEEARYKGINLNNIRTGIHTTNMTAVFPDGPIVIYDTGLHHAGEALEKLFSLRTLEEQVIIMADASSSNTCKIKNNLNLDFVLANCNSHALRKFKELAESEAKIAKEFGILNYKNSEELSFFLVRYKQIFENEKKTKDLTPEKRLVFHKTHSKSIMLEMKNRIESDLIAKNFEPNSDFGKTCLYFKNHFTALSAFCDVKSAPVCNNLSERMLKCIIQHRKNSLFFKNTIGSAVGDIITSLLFTAKSNDLNSIEYFKNLLIYKSHWKNNPAEWLPWNYKTTMQKMVVRTNGSSAATAT